MPRTFNPRRGRSMVGVDARWVLASALLHGAVITFAAMHQGAERPPRLSPPRCTVQASMLQTPASPKADEERVVAVEPEPVVPPPLSADDAPEPQGDLPIPATQPQRVATVPPRRLDEVLHDRNERLRQVEPVAAALAAELPAPPSEVECATPRAAVFAPAVSDNPPPEYPAAARRRHVEGTVCVRITIADDGRALQCVVVASSGSHLLDDAALAAARRWRFERGPGTVDVPFVFELRRAS